MKTNAKTWIAVVALTVGTCAMETFGNVSVSASVRISAVSDFHEPLASHGSWVEVRSYGHCWRPAGIAVGWQPYSYGSWVWTTYGWYWESDEPWGWACYHYGNWVYDAGFGWVWVPGIEWSPAWVSWRVGGGYWGWAPLPPRGVVVAPRAYVFVEGRHFHERIGPSTVVVNNTTVIDKTTEIKNVRREVTVKEMQAATAPRIVVNEGPNRAELEKATGSKVRELAARDLPMPREPRNAPETKSDKPAAAKRDGTIPDQDKPTLDKPAQPTPPNQPSERREHKPKPKRADQDKKPH